MCYHLFHHPYFPPLKIRRKTNAACHFAKKSPLSQGLSHSGTLLVLSPATPSMKCKQKNSYRILNHIYNVVPREVAQLKIS